MTAYFPLDQELRHVAERLTSLTHLHIATYFAARSEQLYPAYVMCSEKIQHGHPAEVRVMLDSAWRAISSSRVLTWKDEIERLEQEYMPHSDEYETLYALFAQDALSCVAAAARALTQEASVDPNWVAIPFGALRASISDEQTGFIDLGDAPERQAFEERLFRDPRVKRMLDTGDLVLAELESNEQITSELIGRIRAQAIAAPVVVGPDGHAMTSKGLEYASILQLEHRAIDSMELTDGRVPCLVKHLVAWLVEADYVAISLFTRSIRLSAEDIQQAVSDYGKKLIMPPLAVFDHLDAIRVSSSSIPTWSVRIDLWTEEEGRSDLTLECTLVDRGNTQLDAEIDNIHVL